MEILLLRQRYCQFRGVYLISSRVVEGMTLGPRGGAVEEVVVLIQQPANHTARPTELSSDKVPSTVTSAAVVIIVVPG